MKPIVLHKFRGSLIIPVNGNYQRTPNFRISIVQFCFRTPYLQDTRKADDGSIFDW